MNKRRKEEKSIRIDSNLAEEISNFLFLLGNQFGKIKNAEASASCFKYSLDLNPKNNAAVFNLGTLYRLTGNLEGSYRMFSEACRMSPGSGMAATALAEVARKLGRLEESERLLDRVLSSDESQPLAISAMSVLHYDKGDLEKALEWNAKALALRPGDKHLLLNRALVHMTNGDWPAWWIEYEKALSYGKNEKMRGLRIEDSWHGEDISGKTLLVISDQGAGDAIQFSRYLAEVKKRSKCRRLIFYAQPELKNLLSRLDGIDEIVGFREIQKLDFDAFSSLLGVMRVLKVSPDDCWRKQSISTDSRLDEVWYHNIKRAWDGRSKKIGLVWAGDPKHGNDHARSIPLVKLLPLTTVEGVQFFSFQVGEAAKQLDDVNGSSTMIQDLSKQIRNYDDTASALTHMDAVVTVDTSIAHLCGSMNIKAFVAISNPPEWRWLRSGHLAKWYSSVSLIRQEEPQKWSLVVKEISEILRRISNA